MKFHISWLLRAVLIDFFSYFFYAHADFFNWIFFVFSADVKMPSGNIDKPVIEDNRDGTVTIKYEPREEGTHELALKYNGEHIQGKAKNRKICIILWKNFFQVHHTSFMLIRYRRVL